MGIPLAVLIVEDSENDAFFIVHTLKKAGYDVVYEQVQNAAQMGQVLENRSWDIVISDYTLPQFDGRAALATLQETGQDIPFIIVSGVIGEETAVMMMKAGAHDYLMKGDLTRLAPAVERELAQSKVRRERRRAEEELSQSEERYRLLVEQLPVVIYRVALDELAATHFISPQIDKLTGYSPTEWITDTAFWRNMLHPEDRERVLAENRRHMAGQPFLSEYRLIGRDGRIIWVRDEAIIIRDGAGFPLYAQGVMSDITGRKQAEMERQVLLEIMQGLVTTTDLQDFLRLVHHSIATVIYAENFFVLLYNKNTALFEEIYSVDQFDEPFLPSRLEKSRSAYVFRTMQPQLMTRERFKELQAQGEVELVGTDSLSWLGVPLKTPTETIGVMVVQDYANPNRYSERDIDFLASIAGQVAQVVVRKQAEEALRESERRERERATELQTIMDTVPAAMMIAHDRQCQVVTGNHTLYEMLHLPLHSNVSLTAPEGVRPTHFKIYVDGVEQPPSELPLQVSAATGVEIYDVEEDYVFNDGTVNHVFGNVVPLFDEKGQPRGAVAAFVDITERKRAEEALAASEAELRAVFASMQDVVLVIDRQGRYLKIAPTNPALLVRPPEELLGKMLDEIFPPELADSFIKAVEQVLDTQQTLQIEYQLLIGRELLWFETFISPMDAASTLWVARDVTERKKAEKDLRLHLTELEMLYESGLALGQLMNPTETAQKILDLIEEKLTWNYTTLRLYNPQDDTLELLAFHQPGLRNEEERRAAEKIFKAMVVRPGDGLTGWAFLHGQTIRSEDVTGDPRYANTSPSVRSGLYVPMIARKRKIGVIGIESEKFNDFSEADERLMTTLATQAAFALENAHLFAEIRQRVEELETLYLVSTALRAISKQDEMLAIVLDQALVSLHTNHGAIALWDEATGDLHIFTARGWFCDIEESSLKLGEDIFGKVFVDKETYISPDFSSDPLLGDSIRRQIPFGWGGACIPIYSAGQMLGVLVVAVPGEWEIAKDEIRQAKTLAEMTGTALHRMRLHEETVHRLEQLQALHAVDQAITSNFDLGPILDAVLHHTITQLRVDAAAVLLLQPELQTLEYIAGKGFLTGIIKTAKIRLDDGFVGQAMLEQRIIRLSNSIEAQKNREFGALWAGEGFNNCYGVPLISKGEVKGVLEVFHRVPFTPEPGWMDYLETLAKQTAIAIDNTQLFDGLQRANQELALAYDATIEGWSRALDLRDQETENHTQRVTRATEIVAEALGLSLAERVHMRRGALLHDIGKMGVPDNILLKPGPLDPAERAIIERHPQLAYEMLFPITYLHPALEIPYCHHEKWDGSGYPQGLKGEGIPLPARIFAIIDVWDALTSDRTYRKAWPKERTIEYIRGQSGSRFDPRVVDIFLGLLDEGRV